MMPTFYSFYHNTTTNLRVYNRSLIDFGSLMLVKEDLKKNEMLDSVLHANIDHAVKALSQVQPSRLQGATLLITGESLLVKICPPLVNKTKMHFLVTTVDGWPQLHQQVVCSDKISLQDIKESHFLGHRCQDQQNSCLQQAREVVAQGLTPKQLQIRCNKLFLTYTTADDKNAINPDVDIITIQTECKLRPSLCGFGGLLEAKSWLEQEKSKKQGLISCIDYVLKQYAVCKSENSFIYNFIIQSEGEMARIDNKSKRTCFVFCNSEGVSMFPPWS
ncbi:uncharacterized protein LOC108921644 [Scleropages formosus]|uniref:uncharacterized protein LOC108921644 n=1 Tax=Scleropages formosus TaxID=113540 RepID=UPI0008782C17|nr:uncharacterized protein LOC108921644 [Scleropages formosus]